MKKGRFALGALVILALVFIVYRPVLPGSFLMDDRRLVETDNPLVTGELRPLSIWFQTDFALSTLVMWREWLAFGIHPGWYHVVNILLHAVSAILIWRVLAELKIPGAWLAGAIFAVHPVCVNSVARIAELKNTLSLSFFLLSLLLFLPNLNPTPNPSPSPFRYALSILAFVLALMSKTSTIMLPAVLLALAVWQNGRITRRDFLKTSPFFALSLAFGLMSSWFQKHQAMTGPPLPPESFGERLALAGHIFWFYLGKALAPVNLNLVYPRWKIDASTASDYVPVVLLIAVVAVCWRFRKGWGRHVLLAVGIFGVTLFPALGFLDSQFLTKWQVSDHLQYLPMIAPITLAAAAIAVLLPVVVFRFASVALILALSILTFQRAEAFTSEENLFRDTLAKNPAAWGTHNDLGVILAARHDFADAETQFLAALKSNPGYADAESNLGFVLLLEGKPQEAEPHLLAALKGKPDEPEIHRRYAMLLMRRGQWREACLQQGQAVTLSPKPGVRTRLDYARLLHQTGNLQGQETQYRKVLEAQPDSIEALNNLAWLLATAPDEKLRNGTEAVQLAERASRLPPVKEMCVPGTLAAAYAEAGRFPEATATAEKAIQDEEAAGETRFASMNRQFLQLYQEGKPFHEQPSNQTNP